MDHHSRHIRHHRLRARLRGNRTRPRVSVFRSNRGLNVQLIDDEAQRTLLAAASMPAAGQTKVAQAQAIGLVFAAKAKSAGIVRVVFDRSGYQYHGRVKAIAEALRAGGLEF